MARVSELILRMLGSVLPLIKMVLINARNVIEKCNYFVEVALFERPREVVNVILTGLYAKFEGICGSHRG